jgi:hypothetical protein
MSRISTPTDMPDSSKSAEGSVDVNQLTFKFLLTNEGNIWTATVTGVTRGSPVDRTLDLRAQASSSDGAVELLRNDLEAAFAIRVPELSLRQLAGASVAWVLKAPSTAVRVRRVIAILVPALIALPFVVNFSTSKQPIVENVRLVSEVLQGEVKTFPKGFITTEFNAAALRQAKREVWFTGVSYRNLVRENRALLDSTLRRGVSVRIILLDPKSPLARPDMMAKFSRTASAADIDNTIERLAGQGGVFTASGRPGKDHIFVSSVAPIVMLVRVDDEYLVSFLFHVDPSRVSSAYDKPYLRLPATSDLGRALTDHVDNLLRSATPISF